MACVLASALTRPSDMRNLISHPMPLPLPFPGFLGALGERGDDVGDDVGDDAGGDMGDDAGGDMGGGDDVAIQSLLPLVTMVDSFAASRTAVPEKVMPSMHAQRTMITHITTRLWGLPSFFIALEFIFIFIFGGKRTDGRYTCATKKNTTRKKKIRARLSQRSSQSAPPPRPFVAVAD